MALLRIEQLYPLRRDLLRAVLEPFRGAARIAWVQEEPRNSGAWSFLRPHLAEILGREAEYIGRSEAASPAVGSHRLHKEEEEEILAKALPSVRADWAAFYLIDNACPQESAMEIKVPEVGESVHEATIAKWHRQEGEQVARTTCSANWRRTKSPWS